MKPFDLKAALAGKPVQLRTGQKAVILYYIPEVYKYEDGTSVSHPLRGIIFNKKGKIITTNEGWTEDGAIALNHEHNFDIVGMWEEPKPASKEVMERAFKEGLLINHTILKKFYTEGFKVIGKTVDGDYILQDCKFNKISYFRASDETGYWSIES